LKFYETTPILPVGPNPYKGIIKEFPKDPTMVVRGFSGWLYDEERADINWLLTDPTPPWLEDVHNKYSGRCFLFGTGPSIVKQLSLLKTMGDEYVFTCNRMKRWEDFPLNPFVHCVTEPQPFLEWGTTIVPDYDHPRAQNRTGGDTDKVAWSPGVSGGFLCRAYRVGIPAYHTATRRVDGFQGVFLYGLRHLSGRAGMGR